MLVAALVLLLSRLTKAVAFIDVGYLEGRVLSGTVQSSREPLPPWQFLVTKEEWRRFKLEPHK